MGLKEIFEVERNLEKDEVIARGAEIVESYQSKKLEEALTSDDIESIMSQLVQYNKLYPNIVETYINKAYLEGELQMLEQAEETLLLAKDLDEERVNEMLEGLKEMFEERELIKTFIDEENDCLTKAFESALEEVFERFSTNKTSLSNEDLNEFHKAVNDEPIGEAALEFLQGSFDVDEKEQITLSGFKEFYMLQTSNVASETLKDLKKLGYNEKLEKISE